MYSPVRAVLRMSNTPPKEKPCSLISVVRKQPIINYAHSDRSKDYNLLTPCENLRYMRFVKVLQPLANPFTIGSDTAFLCGTLSQVHRRLMLD